MNHDEIKNELPAYHDHELPADRIAQLEQHVFQCSECQSQLTELQHLSSIVAPLAGIEDTEQFIARVMNRLPEPRRYFWQTMSGWWRVPALAGLALLLVSITTQRTDTPPTTSSLLCSGTSSTAVKHLCSDDTAHPDELMNLVWGDL